jgi:hypothetical protein
MTAVTKLRGQAPTEPLAKLREPVEARHISKLPNPTKAQTDAVKADFKKGIRCKDCGSWHHPDVVHLDYVGHAALTDRLLDVDPMWSWEPAALRDGLPAFDQTGGLWIRLTICGVTRLGYGHAAAKPGQDPGAREKEVIGDALRNAAMRFGAALDLWHKGDLHAPEEGKEDPATEADEGPSEIEKAAIRLLTDQLTAAAFKKVWEINKDGWKERLEPPAYARVVACMKQVAEKFQRRAEAQERTDALGIGEDEIPY